MWVPLIVIEDEERRMGEIKEKRTTDGDRVRGEREGSP